MRDLGWLTAELALDQDLAVRFWIVFARFEYALKRADHARGDDKHIEADWPKLAVSLGGVWNADRTQELRSAVDFFLQHPPKKQVLLNSDLGWADSVLPEHEPALKRMIV